MLLETHLAKQLYASNPFYAHCSISALFFISRSDGISDEITGSNLISDSLWAKIEAITSH